MDAEKVVFPRRIVFFLTDIKLIAFAKAVYIKRQGDIIIRSVIQGTAYFRGIA